MKKIILVRHGLTDFLAAGRYQGHSDPPLNAEGRRQIENSAPRFSGEKPEIIFCSVLQRARESAEILNRELNLEIHEDVRLREMSFGDWEGRTYDEIIEKFPEAFEWWNKDLTNFRPSGGESLTELVSRVHEFYEAIKNRSEEVVAVVAHGGVIRAFMVELMGLRLDSFWSFELDLASVTVIDLEKESRVHV
ncbi:MAG: alpha-ribazole phosphatase [Candidatus Omnitrophica bacterium]|nr:alpha-ribazole phosphatase [Candidatus Omnitrophota bacterium]